MNILTLDARAVNVAFTKDDIQVALSDGRKVSAPLEWLPRAFLTKVKAII